QQFANRATTATRPFSAGSADLASAATLAAVAAAAAVTAAASDRQWHPPDRQQRRTTHETRAKRSFGNYYDVESQSASSDEEDREDEDESERFSDSDEETKEDLEDRLQNEALLFDSGELLLHERGKKKPKRSRHDSTYSQGNGIKSGKKPGDIQTLLKWKTVLRNALLDVCRVLSMIDSRIGGRQTRVLLCVTGTNVPTGSTSAVVKLATFMKLVDRLLMQPPEGGTSGDVTVVLDPQMTENANDSKPEPNEGSSACTLWTPNVIVLVTATVPSPTHPNCANSLQSTRSMSASLPNPSSQTPLLTPGFPRTNFKFWWSIHHKCHLPIYLEDNPPGYHISEPHRLQHTMTDCHRFSLPTATELGFVKLPFYALRLINLLAPAVETARQKALSASLSAFQSGADFTNRRPPFSYPPHVNSTLEMCELALRDRDPRRLAEFLQISEKNQSLAGDILGVGLPERAVPPFLEAGRITVAQLISVMKLTPFLNPQISKWIEGKHANV
ncbi:hypothetical protein AHF37_10531, partial [Paragonimus kellicotti]